MSVLKNKRDDWGFLNLGEVKIANLKKEIESYYFEWLMDTSRQKQFNTHEHTFMFAIKQFDYGHDLTKEITSKALNSLKTEEANNELSSLISYLENLVEGKAIRIEFINMKPKSRIRTHKDRSDVLYLARRFHIPIKTNELVIFTSGKYQEHLQEGHLYELNNINYHNVHNKSTENRIHLIIDVLPIEHTKNIRFE